MAKRYRIHTEFRVERETSKDEVIYHLALLLAKYGNPVRVVYPDGFVMADFVGADGEVVAEE